MLSVQAIPHRGNKKNYPGKTLLNSLKLSYIKFNLFQDQESKEASEKTLGET